MLSLYMDHQFRVSVTRGLRQRGVDVLTALEDGRHTIPDPDLLARATGLNRLLVTHDKGFLSIAHAWQSMGREFAGIVFTAQEPLDIGKAIEFLELIAKVYSPDEMRNRVEYIPTS